MMYAVVKVSGFQYIVREGDTITVPRLAAEPGSKVNLEEVLFLRANDKVVIGRPNVPKSYIEAEVIDHPRTSKITVFKFRRRENYRRKKGHRQALTRVRISKILYEE